MRKFSVAVFLAIFVVLFFSAMCLAEFPWSPYKGSSVVDQTRTEQYFRFSNSGVKEFGLKSTYECETQIYNKNFADREKTGHRSSLPRWYVDTQRCDWGPFADGTVDNFTIGSAEASSIKGETEYYTYIKLKPSSVKSATVRIKGQKGHRIIDSKYYPLRYSEWNINPDSGCTTGSLVTFEAPSGKRNWGGGVDNGRVYARH